MTVKRWSSDSNWHVYLAWYAATKGCVIYIHNIRNANKQPQWFHLSTIRKMLRRNNFTMIEHFDETLIPILKQTLKEKD